MRFRVDKELTAGGFQRAAKTNAGKNILQKPPLGLVKMHVVGGDQGYASRAGKLSHRSKVSIIVGAVVGADRQVQSIAENVSVQTRVFARVVHGLKILRGVLSGVCHHRSHQPL